MTMSRHSVNVQMHINRQQSLTVGVPRSTNDADEICSISKQHSCKFTQTKLPSTSLQKKLRGTLSLSHIHLSP